MMMNPASMTLNMDLCMEAAQEFCGQEMSEFNESPFDEMMLNSLDSCVRAYAKEIEAKCSVVKQEVSSWFFMQPPDFHPQCRHPEDPESELPLCDSKHHCMGRPRPHALIIVAIVLLAAAFSAGVCCFIPSFARRRYTHVANEEMPAEGEPIVGQKFGYAPLGQQSQV
jgi:hypothetical protein